MKKSEIEKQAARNTQRKSNAAMRAIKKAGIPPHVRNERSTVTWEVYKTGDTNGQPTQKN